MPKPDITAQIVRRTAGTLGIVACLLVASCSGGDDNGGEAQSFVGGSATVGSTEELLDDAPDGSGSTVLDSASDQLDPGPPPIGPNTLAVLGGPPFEGLSSLASGCILENQDDAQQNLYLAAVSEQRLALDDVVTLREPAAQCAPDELATYFVNELADRSAATLSDPTVECMTALLSGDRDAYLAPLAGLTAIDLDQPVPEFAAVATVDGLTTCFGAESVSETVRNLIADNPMIGEAADLACVDASLAEPNASRGFWTRFVQYSAIEPDLIPAEADAIAWSPLETCFSVGRLVNSVTTNYGFTLTSTGVACIDEAATDRSIVGRVLSDNEPDPAEFMPVLTECATPEELAALQG